MDPSNILSTVSAIENKVKIATSEIIYENMTSNVLKTAAEMLNYLNSEIKFDSTKSWLKFYWTLFKTKSPNEIILTLNRIMKKSKNTNEKLLRKSASLLALKYEDIQSMMPGRTKSISASGFTYLNINSNTNIT